PNIPLRGIAIGNGWMKAAVQVLHYPEMAFQSGTAPHAITRKDMFILGQLQHFLNRRDVQEKLRVKKHFIQCSDVGSFSRDAIMPSDFLLPDLIEAGIRVLLCAGDQDYICNWIGYEKVAEQMEWAGRDAFQMASRYEYEVMFLKALASNWCRDNAACRSKDNNGTSVGLLRSIRWKEKGMFGFFQVGNFSFDRIAPFDTLLPDLLDAEVKIFKGEFRQDNNGTALGLLRRIRWRNNGMLGFLQ
ncbi:hypothetical protein FOL47_002196, partial [Perkinsus chesapeaki]